MSDTNGGDVERHFLELQSQLQEDGFEADSQVMKTTNRLMKALRSDGFAFAMPDVEEPAETEEEEQESAVEAEALPEADETSAPKEEAIHVVAWPAKGTTQTKDAVALATRIEQDLRGTLQGAPEEESIIRAFRTKDAFDSTVIESVFASIDGWKTKVIQHKGSHFVIATNAKRLTENRVKQALVDYVTELKATSA